jgi:putative flippase GtrA
MLKKYLKQTLNIRNSKDLFKLISDLVGNQKIRFLIIGFYNTIVSYVLGFLYFKFVEVNFIKIIFYNIIITIHSFISHKFLSFRKSQFSFKEIRRAVIVYGSMYLFSATLILMIIKLGYSQLFAYHVNILASIIIFYFLHSNYTFR